MSASASRPTSSSSRRRPRTCSPRPRTATPTTCSPSTLLTARCPVVFAPAMHTEMWQHPATQANVATLRSAASSCSSPRRGRLTGVDTGPGRLPEPAAIFALASSVLERGAAVPDLTGRRVVVTAGGTREYLDPVRFLGNRSSGKQGYALAMSAAARGADVTVVAANVELPDPAGVDGRQGRSRPMTCTTPCWPPPRTPTRW